VHKDPPFSFFLDPVARLIARIFFRWSWRRARRYETVFTLQDDVSLWFLSLFELNGTFPPKAPPAQCLPCFSPFSLVLPSFSHVGLWSLLRFGISFFFESSILRFFLSICHCRRNVVGAQIIVEAAFFYGLSREGTSFEAGLILVLRGCYGCFVFEFYAVSPFFIQQVASLLDSRAEGNMPYLFCYQHFCSTTGPAAAESEVPFFIPWQTRFSIQGRGAPPIAYNV